MMRSRFTMLCLLLAALPLAVRAAEPHVVKVVDECQPTPKLLVENYPGGKNIPNGNNLLRPAGKALDAGGQRLVLMGRVFDSHCIPIAGATIELWQADPFGRWLLATPEDLVNPNPVFAGAGRTYTDNNGQFIFTTAFPAPAKGRAPHLNIRVEADEISPFTTQLYFSGDTRNETDPAFKRLPAASRRQVTLGMQAMGSSDAAAGYSGVIDLVLPGRTPYHRY